MYGRSIHIVLSIEDVCACKHNRDDNRSNHFQSQNSPQEIVYIAVIYTVCRGGFEHNSNKQTAARHRSRFWSIALHTVRPQIRVQHRDSKRAHAVKSNIGFVKTKKTCAVVTECHGIQIQFDRQRAHFNYPICQTNMAIWVESAGSMMMAAHRGWVCTTVMWMLQRIRTCVSIRPEHTNT